MRYFWIPAILLVALLGCGGRDAVRMDTAAPNSARSGDVFQPAVELFDGNVLSPMVDADVGEILNGPGTGGDVGTPWADSTGRHWAVAVALQRLPASTSCRIAATSRPLGGEIVISCSHGVNIQPGLFFRSLCGSLTACRFGVARLCKRLRRHADGLFTFLLDENIDHTNNHAEREIRPAVIMRKVMQQNRSDKAAHTREVLMSVYRTPISRGRDPVKTVAYALSIHLETGKPPDLPCAM